MYILQVGTLPFQPHEKAKMEADWQAMSVVSLRIKVTPTMIGEWYNDIMVKSTDFEPEKTYDECRVKFLEGLPPQLSAEVDAEYARPNPDYRFPARGVRSQDNSGDLWFSALTHGNSGPLSSLPRILGRYNILSLYL